MPKEKETPDELQHDVLIRAAQLLLEKEEGKEVPKEKEVHEVKANDDGTVTLDGVTFERKDPEKVTAIDPEPEKKRFGAPAIQHKETKREVKDFQVSRAI